MNTEIGLKERVDAIKVGSSAYNYYMNTPLSELKTREEKLIKQELESRSMTALSEGDTTNDIDDTATIPEDGDSATIDTTEPVQKTKILIPHFSNDEGMSAEKQLAVGTAAFAGSAASVGILSKILDEAGYLKPVSTFFTDTLPNKIFGEALNAVKELPGASFISSIFNTITIPIKGLWTFFSKSGEWLYNLLLKPIGQTVSGVWDGLGSLFSTIPGIKNLYNLIKQGTDYIISGTVSVINSWVYGVSANAVEPSWYTKIPYLGDKFKEIGWGVGNPGNSIIGSDTLTSMQKYTATTVFLALTIIVVALIWKVARYFVKDDGEVVDGAYWEEINIEESLEYNYLTKSLTPVTKYGNMLSEDYNPFYNNLSLAFLTEAAENKPNISTIITTGDQSVTALLSDSKFIKFMSDKQPDLLRLFEKYKNDNKSQILTESDVPEVPAEETEVMPTDNTDNGSIENGSTTGLFDSIVNMFKKAGSVTADSLNYVKDKIIQFKRKFTDSPHTLVRWIPTAVETALAALAIYYLWNTNRDQLTNATSIGVGVGGAVAGADALANGINAASDNDTTETPSETEVEQEAFVINQYINALNVISEAMDDIKKNNIVKIKVDKVLDGFNGKSDKMSSQIIDRAKKVSVDLLNQDEFITFSKKYNPEAITILKKASKLK